MRGLTGKYKIEIYDLVDDLNGYIIEHSKAREKIYKNQNFPITKHMIDLSNF